MSSKYITTLLLLSFGISMLGNDSFKALHQKRAFTSKDQQHSILLKIAELHWERQQQDSAFEYIHQLHILAEDTQNESYKDTASFKIADFYRFQGKYTEAIQQYEHFTISSQDKALTAKAYNAWGVCAYYLGNYEIALNQYRSSLELYKSLNNSKEVAKLNTNIGYIHLAIKNYAKALQYFETSAQTYQDLNDLEGYVKELNNIGYTWLEQNNKIKAKAQFEHVLQLTDTLPTNMSRGSALHNLAELVINEGKTDLGLNYLIESVKIDEFYKRPDRIAESFNTIGTLYQDLGNYAKAEYYLKESWHLAKQQNALRELMEASNNLVSLYGAMGQYQKGYGYIELYNTLKDSLYNIQEVNAIQDFEKQLETAKHQQKIELLSRENALQKRISWWTILGSIFIILALSLGLYSFWLRKQVWEEKAKQEKAALALQQTKTEKLETELAFRNRELVSIALQSFQKNELLLKIQQQLAKLKSTKYSPHLNQSIDKISKTLSSNFQLEEEWTSFQLHFEKVHPNFFSTLQKRFPTLSQIELKQCAYIKIGLSSKEIARLININNSSVHMAHYRIKKKLALDKETSLQAFIQDL